MKKKLSQKAIEIWQRDGREIFAARNGKHKPDDGFGIRGLCDRYGLGFREAERLLLNIDRFGPIPPDQFDIGEPPTIKQKEFEPAGDVVWSEGSNQAAATGRVKTLDELLNAAGVDRSKWRVDSWQARSWDANIGDGVVEPMHYVKANLERLAGDTLRGVQQIKPIKKQPKSKEQEQGFEKVLLIPDTQVGYRRQMIDGSFYLNPMHDRRAMDAVWQVCADVQPHTIILLGDMLDLAEMSTKYPRPMDLINTSQPAILEMAWWCRWLRQLCPSSTVTYMAGNHEERLERLTIEKAQMTQGLHGAGEQLPALAIERLLDLESIDIEYVKPFGADYWLWSDTPSPVKIHHGEIVRAKGGQTVAAQLAKYHHSVVGGHIHRVELAMATNHGPKGKRQRFAMSPGCLCKTDGTVPGATLHPDWQQGFGMIARNPKTGELFPSVHSVIDGETFFNGKQYKGRELEAKISRDVNWKELSKSAI